MEFKTERIIKKAKELEKITSCVKGRVSVFVLDNEFTDAQIYLVRNILLCTKAARPVDTKKILYIGKDGYIDYRDDITFDKSDRAIAYVYDNVYNKSNIPLDLDRFIRDCKMYNMIGTILCTKGDYLDIWDTTEKSDALYHIKKDDEILFNVTTIKNRIKKEKVDEKMGKFKFENKAINYVYGNRCVPLDNIETPEHFILLDMSRKNSKCQYTVTDSQFKTHATFKPIKSYDDRTIMEMPDIYSSAADMLKDNKIQINIYLGTNTKLLNNDHFKTSLTETKKLLKDNSFIVIITLAEKDDNFAEFSDTVVRNNLGELSFEKNNIKKKDDLDDIIEACSNIDNAITNILENIKDTHNKYFGNFGDMLMPLRGVPRNTLFGMPILNSIETIMPIPSVTAEDRYIDQMILYASMRSDKCKCDNSLRYITKEMELKARNEFLLNNVKSKPNSVVFIETDESDELIDVLEEVFTSETSLVVSGWIENDTEVRLNNIEDLNVIMGESSNFTGPLETDISGKDLVSLISIMNQMNDPKYERLVVILEISEYIINNESDLIYTIDQINSMKNDDIRVILLCNDEKVIFNKNLFTNFESNCLKYNNGILEKNDNTINYAKSNNIINRNPTLHATEFIKYEPKDVRKCNIGLDHYLKAIGLKITETGKGFLIDALTDFDKPNYKDDLLMEMCTAIDDITLGDDDDNEMRHDFISELYKAHKSNKEKKKRLNSIYGIKNMELPKMEGNKKLSSRYGSKCVISSLLNSESSDKLETKMFDGYTTGKDIEIDLPKKNNNHILFEITVDNNTEDILDKKCGATRVMYCVNAERVMFKNLLDGFEPNKLYGFEIDGELTGDQLHLLLTTYKKFVNENNVITIYPYDKSSISGFSIYPRRFIDLIEANNNIGVVIYNKTDLDYASESVRFAELFTVTSLDVGDIKISFND
jgi:hypothetical protein